MDRYDIATSLCFQTNHNDINIDKTKFDIIDKIIKCSNNFSSQDWDDCLNEHDALISCAILSSDNAPDTVKYQAVDCISYVFNCSRHIIVPFLFSTKKQCITELPLCVQEELSKLIDCKGFIKELERYSFTHPESTELSISGTPLETLILHKILQSKELDSKTLEDYNTYKLIEYCKDEGTLLENLPDFSNAHPYILSAIINNPFVSNKIKTEALNAGADISEIHRPQSEQLMNDIYRSLVEGIEYATDNSVINANVEIIEHFLYNNLLSPACEIDIIKRYKTSGGIPMSYENLHNFLQTTTNKDILYEALDSAHNISVLSNPNFGIKETKDYIQQILNEANKSKYMNFFDKERLSATLPHIQLSMELYNNIMHYLLIDRGDEVVEKLCRNPYTPLKVLENYIGKKVPSTLVAEFNLLSRDKLLFEDCQKFLETINAMLMIENHLAMNEKIHIEPSSLPKLSIDQQFLPHYSSKENNILREILQQTIENKSVSNINVAQKYLQILNKKDAYDMAKDNYPKCCADSVLSIISSQEVLLDKIFCTKNRDIDIYDTTVYERDLSITGNIYEQYMLYAELVKNIDIYIDTFNQEKHLIEESIKFLNNNKNLVENELKHKKNEIALSNR